MTREQKKALEFYSKRTNWWPVTIEKGTKGKPLVRYTCADKPWEIAQKALDEKGKKWTKN